MRVTVPSAVVQNSYTAFPAGNYDGTLTGAQVRDPNGDGSWVIIKVSAGDISPREGTADPGREKFSGDITIRNTDKDTGEAQDLRELSEVNGNLHWSIERGAGLLAGMGAAFGVAEVDDAGNVSVDLGALATALIDGQFEGERFGFEVTNRTRDGKTYDGFRTIGPAL